MTRDVERTSETRAPRGSEVIAEPDGSSVASRVVTAVAEATGEDPTDLSPLHATIDADALDALLASAASRHRYPQVTFEYEGHEVTVDGDGTVTVQSID